MRRELDVDPAPAQGQVRVMVELLADRRQGVDELGGGRKAVELDRPLQPFLASLPIRMQGLEPSGDLVLREPLRHAITVLLAATLPKVDGRLVWIDCEMTGLDLRRDALIEVAAIVTDADLNLLDAGIDIVIHAEDDVLGAMVAAVTAMHGSSGLTEEVRRSSVTLGEAERAVLDYVRSHVADPKSAPLCGNSIATDRAFLARDMPGLDDYLHYRMIDVSSIKELTRRWYQRVYYAQPEKGLAHRALADIQESIRELAFYRRTIFVPQPGPSSEQARAVAEEILSAQARPVN
jgi:oligoribonuclease